MRHIDLVLLAVLAVGLGSGCKKSQSEQSVSSEPIAAAKPSTPSTPPADTIARLHWLGKKRLTAETNATYVMSVWSLPESEKLGAQTLDKLALSPWRLLKSDAATNGAPTAQLRSLLEDLCQEELFLEVRSRTNQPGELICAIRLSPERAGAWQTNLATVMESLTDVPVTPAKGGWSLKQPDVPRLIELSRAGEWTVLSLAAGRNELLAETLARIEREGTPVTAQTKDPWLSLALDLPRVTKAFSLDWRLPEDLPQVSLALTGDGTNVHTRGELNFPRPLGLDLAPWNIPTNLINDPLISFTAVRGIKPWLSSLKAWQNLEIGEPPNQIYVWGLGAAPFQTYFAAPSDSASNQVFQLTERLVEQGSACFSSNAIGKFVRLTEGNGVRWTGLPFITPVLQSVGTGEAQFIKGSFFPIGNTNKSMPIELVYAVLGQTNLIGYDWEITAPRFDGWTGVGQSLRLSLGRPRMPATSAAVIWLRKIKLRLGNSTTGVMMTGPDRLEFIRRSSIGLTALELQLFADWLESPQFPSGLHTLLAPSDFPWLRPPSAPDPSSNP